MLDLEQFLWKEMMMTTEKTRRSKKEEKMEKRGPDVQNVVAMGVVKLKTGERATLDVS